MTNDENLAQRHRHGKAWRDLNRSTVEPLSKADCALMWRIVGVLAVIYTLVIVAIHWAAS